jgi:para-nitrobenzyl esterase
MIQRNASERHPLRTLSAVALTLIASSFGACAGLIPLAASAAPAPQVRVHQGRLQGKDLGGGISAFLGIPFAAAPTGALRWQLPQPPTSWNGERLAIRYSPACTQDRAGYGGLFAESQSEDCLYLNLWSPDLKPKKRMAVMVYLHGGGFTGGAGTIPSFDGMALAKQGVITVTVNYRLGVFGFFAHPALSAESPHKASGNYGLADQLAALHWVKDNIAAFGGDPARIIIFGQSAGAISVMDLMTSPLARGLISGAIAESGTPMLGAAGTSLIDAEKQGNAFADAQGQSIAQFRAMSADELMQRWSKFAASNDARTWPIVDGWVLPKAPADIFAAHGEMTIPLMTGSNAREALHVPTDLELPQRLRDVFGDGAQRAEALYPAAAPPDPILGSTANMFATDVSFRCPAEVIETWHAQRGSPVYAYQFEQTLPGREAAGSQHSDEVAFVFGTLNMMKIMWGGAEVPPPAAKLSDAIVAYWANFAKNGDPNGPGVSPWPRFTTKDGAYLHLNGSGIRADTRLRTEACAFYREAAMPRLMTRNALREPTGIR